MPTSSQSLSHRRLQLQQRSRELREQLVQDAEVLQPWLGTVDRVRSAAHWLQRHPLWVAGLVAALVVARPSRAITLGLKLWSGWQMWQRVRATLGGLLRRT